MANLSCGKTALQPTPYDLYEQNISAQFTPLTTGNLQRPERTLYTFNLQNFCRLPIGAIRIYSPRSARHKRRRNFRLTPRKYARFNPM